MVALTVLSATAAFAETENFDRHKPGSPPEGWSCGVTGRGSPLWAVAADPSAPSAPNVLRQTGKGTFPWCVKKTAGGKRTTIKYVDAPVPQNVWHTLRVEFAGTRIKVLLDGRPYIEQEDSHIPGAGAVGVWTKADSVTAFDDFSYGSIKEAKK